MVGIDCLQSLNSRIKGVAGSYDAWSTNFYSGIPSTSIENFELQLLEVLFISKFDQDGVIQRLAAPGL